MQKQAPKFQQNMDAIISYINEQRRKQVDKIKSDLRKEKDLEEEMHYKPEKERLMKKIDKELEEYKTKMKIKQSQNFNKIRLEKLKVKIDCVNDIFEQAKKTLRDRIQNNKKEYQKILKNLIIQGCIRLLDNKINVICKKSDYDLVKGILNDAKDEFLEKLKKEAKKSVQLPKFEVTLDGKNFLPENLTGGVFLTSLKTKIRVDNTLDKRLSLLQQNSTPQIREVLFADEIAARKREKELKEKQRQEMKLKQEVEAQLKLMEKEEEIISTDKVEDINTDTQQ